MYNKVILAGNLTKDPELRYSQQGLSICRFGLAVNSDFGRQSDDSKKETLFIDVVTFGNIAEACGKYLSKGRPVLVDGRLQESRWETEDGQKRSKIEVIANLVKFLSKKSEDTPTSRRDANDYVPPETTVEDPF